MPALTFSHNFSTSAPWSQRPSHPLYLKIDWAIVTGEGKYAVVNPFDPEDIMYFGPEEFAIQVRVSLTQRHRLIVLATPYSSHQPGSAHREGAPQEGDSGPGGGPEQSWGGNRESWSRRVSASMTRFLHQYLIGKGLGGLDKHMKEGRILVSSKVLAHLLSQWFIRITFWAVGQVRLDPHSSSDFVFFLNKIMKIYTKQGLKGLIVQLKAGLYILNAAAAREPVPNSWATGVPVGLSKGGFPKFLSPSIRTAIRNGDSRLVRVYASLLNVYKTFWFEGHAKFETIIDGPTCESSWVISHFRAFAQNVLWPLLQVNLKEKHYHSVTAAREFLQSKDIFSCAAGPNHKVSGLGAEHDAASWAVEQQLREDPLRTKDLYQTNMYWYALRSLPSKLASLIGDNQFLIHMGEAVNPTWFRFRTDLEIKLEPVAGDHEPNKWFSYSHREDIKKDKWSLRMGCVGKISPIYEAAGKVRMVAITDHWTQRICAPFHAWLEGVLRTLPADSTFDQDEGLQRYVQAGHPKNFSFDISAATDRIPRSLYLEFFSGCLALPQGYAALWLQLLSDRSWDTSRRLHKDLKYFDRLHPDRAPSRFLRYGTGQPMGALSSWPSMALLHHALVQFAAYLAAFPGKCTLEEMTNEGPLIRGGLRLPRGVTAFKLFTAYALLGDDIVIGDERVAQLYLELMKAMGVSISLAKSYQSVKGLVNFANRTFINKVEISPISLKEELAITSLYGRFAFAFRMLSRGYLGGKYENFLAPPVGGLRTLIQNASLPSLMKLMCPSPLLWKEDWSASISLGKVRSDMFLALVLWCYPVPHVSALLGLPLRSYRPLARVLLEHKSVWTLGPVLRADQAPEVLAQDSKFLFVLIAMLRYLVGPQQNQARGMLSLMRGKRKVKFWETVEMLDEYGLRFSKENGNMTGKPLSPMWAVLRKLSWAEYMSKMPDHVRVRMDRYWTPFLGSVLTKIMNKRSIFYALQDAILQGPVLFSKGIRCGYPVYIGETMYQVFDRKLGRVNEDVVTDCFQALAEQVPVPDFSRQDHFKVFLREERDPNLSLFRLLNTLKVSLDLMDLPIRNLSDFK